MSAKQDRTYTRTASDLERKLNLKERFSEVMGVAESALSATEENKVGTNLYTGTRDFSGSDWASTLGLWSNDGTYQGLTVKTRVGDWQALKQYISVQAGETYTISAYVKCTGVFTLAPDAGNIGTGAAAPAMAYNATSDWTRISCTFTVTKSGTIAPGFESNTESGQLWICGLKLEKGNRATEWCPNQADTELSQENVFNALTNNGKAQGLYRDEDGNLFINASYLASGIISSNDGKMKIDLTSGSGPVFNTGITTNGLLVRGEALGLGDLLTAKAIEANIGGSTVTTLVLGIFGSDGDPVGVGAETYTLNGSTLVPEGYEFYLTNSAGTRKLNFRTGESHARIRLLNGDDTAVGWLGIESDGTSQLSISKINGKTVSWKANGDGTYTLIGT